MESVKTENNGSAPDFKSAELDRVLDAAAGDPGSLIAVLQKAQDIYGYLSDDVIYRTAEKLGCSPAKVRGVATFYTQFRFRPVGRYLIMLCQGTACHVNGSEGIARAVYETVGIRDGETSEDGLFTLKQVACLGCCSLSPVMMINGETYGSLTPEKARQILLSLRASAGAGTAEETEAGK